MIQLRHIEKTFFSKNQTLAALTDVSLDIKTGEAFGVIGESGAGKSTLLRMINALETPDAGSVTVDGVDLTHLSKKDLRMEQKQIGMIFQQFNLLNNKTVAENIRLPLTLHNYDQTLTVDEVLDFVGLSDKKHSYPQQLSGGAETASWYSPCPYYTAKTTIMRRADIRFGSEYYRRHRGCFKKGTQRVQNDHCRCHT